MVKLEAIARYRRKGLNPFQKRLAEGDLVRITVEVESNIFKKDLENYARKATPRGYEFIEVIRNKKYQQ